MPHCTPRSVALCLTLCPLIFPSVHAQTPIAPNAQANQPAYTIHTGSRLVLTDVTVTDRAGNPVHNLPSSSFHIFDGNVPQSTSSFEEHTAALNKEITPAVPANDIAHPKGVYTNDFLLHAPPVLNIIVLDIINIRIEDQMYLSYQLTQYLKNLPPGEMFAIYERGGPVTVLLQGFTSDRALLLAAVHRGLPHFPPLGAIYLSDFETLRQLSNYLGDLPGRKNLLWFSGGSTFFLQPDPTQFQDVVAMRRVYDSLEANRIAVYPIDARGLTVNTDTGMLGQHALMSEVAEATGGHAFFNNNGLKEAAAHIAATGGDFYTLTYSPRDYKEDKKWHKVKITLDAADASSYTLSYRRGYFADGYNATARNSAPPVKRLFADGVLGTDQASAHATPIVFKARVIPASDPANTPPAYLSPPSQGKGAKPRRGAIPYSVHYDVPAESLTITSTHDKKTLEVVVAAFAFNQLGTVVDHRAQSVAITINEEQLRLHPHAEVPLDLDLQLSKGEVYLMLAVIDQASGRSGNIQISLDVPAVPKPGK